jgi:hypothetical protein
MVGGSVSVIDQYESHISPYLLLIVRVLIEPMGILYMDGEAFVNKGSMEIEGL